MDILSLLDKGVAPKKAAPMAKLSAKEAFKINQQIEAMIAENGTDPTKYSSEQRKFLQRYTGYGGLGDVGGKGKGLFYDFYTPPPIIQAMWGLALKHGFEGGYALEPSAGIGDFIGFAPSNAFLKNYMYFHAIEISEQSAAILRILYPEVKLDVASFESLFINPDNNKSVKGNVNQIYDLVIGNPPYGSLKRYGGSREFNMGEGDYTEAKSYDEYFMLRSLDILKPGGLLVFIIGTEVAQGGTPFLQKGRTKAKRKIAERGELLEAFRLPNGVFDRTDVLSDILVIRKKEL